VVTGEDTESLLYAWLAEILAVMDAERLVLRRADVGMIEKGRVTGTVYGEPLDRERHRTGVSIKAVTYHQFAVEQTQEGWRARVFLDL
jgi:SHS2 domain-containing protein